MYITHVNEQQKNKEITFIKIINITLTLQLFHFSAQLAIADDQSHHICPHQQQFLVLKS